MAAQKKVQKYVKVQIEAGKATPAPPLGPALGQAGVQIGDFVNKFNAATKDMKGKVTARIYVYEDRTYDFKIVSPLATELIKRSVGIDKGSARNTQTKVGKITQAQLEAIATEKMADLNAHTVEQAAKIIAGSARSMGIEVVK